MNFAVLSMIRYIFFILLLHYCSFADVKSIEGHIKFDVQSNGQSEMLLNSTGLAIGESHSPSANLEVQGNALISGTLSVGSSTTGSSNLNISGSFGYGLSTYSSNATLGDSSFVLADTSSQDITLTLPYAGNVNGRLYKIKKTSTQNILTLHGGGNTIDDRSEFLFGSGNLGYMNVISNGSEWYILDQSESVSQWTPQFISTSLWLDASDASSVLAGSSDNVYQWNDKSGNDKHATTNTASLQPTTNGNTIGGLNALAFDASDELDSGDSNYWNRSSMNLLVATVVVNNGGTNFRAFIGARNSDGSLSFPDHATTAGGFRVNTRSTPSGDNFAGDGDSSTNSVFSTQITSTSLIMRDNGAEVSNVVYATATPNVNTDSPLHIGGRGTAGSTYFHGLMGELIIIKDGTTSLDTLKKLEGYLAWKWGLESQLDASHPYKNYAP